MLAVRGASSCLDGSGVATDMSSLSTQLTCDGGSSSEPSPQKTAAISDNSLTKVTSVIIY